jgi:soluble lytic murein transglycosylase-like protein
MVMNRQHASCCQGDSALRQIKRGAGRQRIGACMARVKAGQRFTIACAILSVAAPATLRASTDVPRPAATSFAYSISHTVKPLPDAVIEKIADTESDWFYGSSNLDVSEKAVGNRIGMPRQLSRKGLCSAVASVARANNLPIPFFANLIWQESSFNTKTISRAGAQGIAQFMPKTAVQFGLINPFEPIHALNVAGKFVRELYAQFGNFGLAAAAYNAGPRRVTDWIAKRGELPGETRNYVIKITGRPADQWISGEIKNDPEATLMPAQAPCVEVAEAVKAQTKTVRMARLMKELTAAAAQARDASDETGPAADPALAAVAMADPDWRSRALRMVNHVLRRLTAKVGHKALVRMAAKSATQPAMKVAMLELSTPDRSPAGKFDEEIGRRKGAVKSPEENVTRTGATVAARADVGTAARFGAKNSNKYSSRNSSRDPASDGPRNSKTVTPEAAKSEAGRRGTVKSRSAKSPSAKSRSARVDAEKHDAPRHRRAQRRATVASSNLDRIF